MQKPVLIASAALICAAVIGIAVYATGSAKKDAGGFAGYPPVKVALASVERRVVPRVFDGVGELEAGRQVQVAAEAAGRITRIAFESGQQVQQGQLLVQLNDAVEQAELIRLKAQLRNAEILHARARKLVERNVASQEQLDNAVAARDMALGAVRQTQALIDQKAIRAPFSGQLGIRRVHLGQYLGVAEPVASLVDARTLKSNFSLDESTSPELKLGQ
ncbi:multidrug efflux RND transporter periplasmic adaptor MexH, partial [Pseudomonas aeruginosa]|nr:multidrug efflux RND transporter periplasmic adaptor MexH [Pseudomonas aeruginosa]